MTSSERVALVFGALGISGWAATRELLRYPTPTTFFRVIALSKRSLDPAVIQLSDARLTFAHGVPDVGRVTDVFWYAYIHKPNDGDLVASNVRILETTLPFIWQTGAKYYGVEYMTSHRTHPNLIPPTPFEESQPRRPEPLYSKIFYYKQLDNELRQGPIIGYAPTTNAMNFALALGVYLALYRAVHGIGATVPLPASLAGARALNSESPADDIACASIFLALKSDPKLKGKGFNAVDSPSTYEARWTALTKIWGLVGSPPDLGAEVEDDPVAPTTRAIEWAQSQVEKWRELEEEHGLRKGVLETVGFDFLYVLSMPGDRRMSTKALKEAGWKEEPDTIKTYEDAWRFFAKAGFLPPL
ncbi:hypothetical protein PENSPDRAFT_748087 [Peniophora sp. CONT]|nr:hypothetical protein PENSPDRAFT_748087 [Peniophora sp. CONT]